MQQYSTFFLIAGLVAVFYFLILRPQRKRQQSMQQTMNALSPGSRVMLGSGVFGTVVSVGPRQVVLEISPGAELTVLKQAITKIVTDADEDSPDEQDELDEDQDAVEQPIELEDERPIEEPTSTTTEPAVEPDTSTTPREAKPPTAE